MMVLGCPASIGHRNNKVSTQPVLHEALAASKAISEECSDSIFNIATVEGQKMRQKGPQLLGDMPTGRHITPHRPSLFLRDDPSLSSPKRTYGQLPLDLHLQGCSTRLP